jgi:transcriptional regulator with PAS, ATPase and Fis domain
MKILISWIGKTDFQSSRGESERPPGPIARTLQDSRYADFDEIRFLNNYAKEKTSDFKKWLVKETKTKANIKFRSVKDLPSPTNFEGVYQAVIREVEDVQKTHIKDVELVFLVSPGTPVMQCIFILLANTKYPAELIEVSEIAGVQTIEVPFEISVDFLLSRADEERKAAHLAPLPDAPNFHKIIRRCPTMEEAVQRARKIAPRDISVLIEGESGTGKDLFAHAIVDSSYRRSKPFITVNCGAIPEGKVESKLFGSETLDPYTNNKSVQHGSLEQANRGTLFLDEVGDLSPSLQVQLLRAIDDGEITRVGGTSSIKVDIRYIASTSHRLNEAVAKGRFRSDLFYRLTADVVRLPPLREREDDISLITKKFMEEINEELSGQPDFKPVELAAGAKNILKNYSWGGNVRELWNILLRSALHAVGSKIRKEEIEDALQLLPVRDDYQILNRTIDEGFDLEEVLNQVSHHYIDRAKKQTGGNLSKAAKSLGFKNYQTLSNRIEKLGIPWP